MVLGLTLRQLTLSFFTATLVILLTNPFSFFDAYPDYASLNTFPDSFMDRISRRVLLLTAHPDDECMFFAPTVLRLVASANEVHSLCLSVGNADGLGETRRHELAGSLDVLGVAPERRRVLDRPFKDNITLFWDTRLVAEHVKAYVLQQGIDVILTFDHQGISSHPNHISLAHGASALLSDATSEAPTSTPAQQNNLSIPRLRVFTLQTVGTVPKYTGAMAAALKRIKLGTCALLAQLVSVECALEAERHAIFVSGWAEYATAVHAMMRHRSQLVWFRWLYILFSRYMWVNDWVELGLEARG